MQTKEQKVSSITVRINQAQEDFIADAVQDYQDIVPIGIKVTKSFIITKLLELGVTSMKEELKQYKKAQKKTA